MIIFDEQRLFRQIESSEEWKFKNILSMSHKIEN